MIDTNRSCRTSMLRGSIRSKGALEDNARRELNRTRGVARISNQAELRVANSRVVRPEASNVESILALRADLQVSALRMEVEVLHDRQIGLIERRVPNGRQIRGQSAVGEGLRGSDLRRVKPANRA